MRAALILVVAAALVQAHMLWQCPAPRYAEDDQLKVYPCGSGADNSNYGLSVTTIAPGPLTVVLKETVVHTGAPARIALSIGNDNGYESYVLLDHIPHDDNQVSGGLYYVTINIPDIDCAQCSLQVIQVMTDKISANPGYCNDLENTAAQYYCQSVYHSCANVKITGKNPTSSFTYTYSPPSGYINPTPNKWSKGESATWTDGWQSGMDTTWQQTVCPAVSKNAAAAVAPLFFVPLLAALALLLL